MNASGGVISVAGDSRYVGRLKRFETPQSVSSALLKPLNSDRRGHAQFVVRIYHFQEPS